MYKNINHKVFDILYDQTGSPSAFDDLGFSEQDMEKMNEIPEGVNDICLQNYCSENFLDSFKEFIDTHDDKGVNLVLEKMLVRINEDYKKFPVNPNNNKFSSVSGTNIITTRVSDYIKETYDVYY
jgi:hypothetical protein